MHMHTKFFVFKYVYVYVYVHVYVHMCLHMYDYMCTYHVHGTHRICLAHEKTEHVFKHQKKPEYSVYS